MATEAKSPECVQFADFEFDCRNGDLRRNGSSLKLQPQPAKVLAVLIRRGGQVVTRQELAEEVWGTDTFVDFEQGLNYAIRQIRSLLEDDADQPRFLETLPKRGYRFIAPVTLVREVEREESASPAPIKSVAERHLRLSPKIWAVSVLVVIVVAGLAALGLRQFYRQKALADPIRSIAVLPLVNLSADPAQDYFSEGLTDELITELARLKTIRVISRTSAMTYKDRRVSAPQIGRELDADALIEGTVERVGGRVRIRAQLIHAVTDRHLWAETYDRDSGDVLLLEKEVAEDIARQIGQISTNPDSRSTATDQTKISSTAHDDYLRGRYYWNKRTEDGLRRGVEYFQKAIDQAPEYALAYSGLADSYIMLANWGFAPATDAYPKAKAAALKAVALNNQLAEAETSLAYVTLLYDRDWSGAEERFRRAISLNPNYASAHHFYSILLVTAGRQAEALAEIRRAQELDPLSLIVNDVVGWIYYEGRQYEQAVKSYSETLQMDASYAPAVLDLGTAYMRQGQYSRAIEELHKAKAIGGENGVILSNLAQAYALSGDRAAAQQILRRVRAPKTKVFVSEWDLALIYLALGEKQKGIELLGQAADKHTGWIIRLGVDPAFDSVRTLSSFQNLVRRAGVPTST